MEIKKIREEKNLTVSLIGRLDAITAIELDKNLRGEIDNVENLTVDLKNLDYIASAGLRILLKLKKRMDIQGTMKVINVNAEVAFRLCFCPTKKVSAVFLLSFEWE